MEGGSRAVRLLPQRALTLEYWAIRRRRVCLRTGLGVGVVPQLALAIKSTTTLASSSPLSSWRKWPPPTIVVCGWSFAPGICEWSSLSAPRVTGSESLKAVRKGFVHWRSTSQARLLAGAAGSWGEVGTRKGKLARALLVGLVRKGHVVGGDDVGGQVRDSLKGLS